MTDIVKKINDITSLTDSQVDREKVKQEAFKNLMGFLNGYIQKTTSKQGLKLKIEELLLDKIEKEGEDLPYGVLIKLLEVLSKNEVDTAIPILKIIENATRQPESSILPNNDNSKMEDASSKVTSDDYKKIKKLLDAISQLEKAEFPEGKK